MNDRIWTTTAINACGLSIIPETLQDAEDIYKNIGLDPDMSRFTGWNPYVTIDATIEKITNDMAAGNDSYSWVIRKDDEFAGTIGAYDYDPEAGSIEIGYSIIKRFWGRGYAGTAAKAVVEFLAHQPHINIIRAWSHKDNIASRSVLTEAGFEEIGSEKDQITYELRLRK